MTKRRVNQLGGEDFAVEDLEGNNTGTGVVDTANLAYDLIIGGQEVTADNVNVARGTSFCMSRSVGLRGIGAGGITTGILWRPSQNTKLVVIHSILIMPTFAQVGSDSTVAHAGAQAVSICMMRSSDFTDYYDFCVCSVQNGDWFAGGGNLNFTPGPTSNVGSTNGFGPRGGTGSGNSKSSQTIGGGPDGPWHCAFPSQEPVIAGIADCIGFQALSTGTVPIDEFDFNVMISGTYYAAP